MAAAGPLSGDADRMASAGTTVVVVEVDGAVAGVIGVRDELRPEAAETVAALRRDGIAVTMLTGDDRRTAAALAAAAGTDDVRAQQLSAAAIESADVAFTGHDLRLIPEALRHARRGRLIMTADIVLALLIIVVLFPLSLFGVLGLAGVVLVHEIAEVVVILNGVRAARRTRVPRAGRRTTPGAVPAAA